MCVSWVEGRLITKLGYQNNVRFVSHLLFHVQHALLLSDSYGTNEDTV